MDTRLKPAEVLADLASATLALDVVEPWFGRVPNQGKMKKLCSDIERLMRLRPEFFARFDYGWATDPACYRTEVDAWMQRELLSVLSLAPASHPDLGRHRATVARLIPSFDFAATTVKGSKCDFILVSEPYLSVVREFAVLLRTLFEKWASAECPENKFDDRWIQQAAEDLAKSDEDGLIEMMEPLQRHAVALARGEAPRTDPPLLDEWLAAGVQNGEPLAVELAVMYQGVDHFLLFHELAHLLHGDDSLRGRTIGDELRADWSATSLALLQLEGPPAYEVAGSEGLLHARIVREVAYGGPTFLQLMRMITLFSETHRWVAVMADISFGTNQEPLRDGGRGLDEIEERLFNMIAIAKRYMPDIVEPVTHCIWGLEHLVICARLLLLRQAEAPDRFEEMPPIDFSHVAARLKARAEGG
jgi:hypothetical protein